MRISELSGEAIAAIGRRGVLRRRKQAFAEVEPFLTVINDKPMLEWPNGEMTEDMAHHCPKPVIQRNNPRRD